MPGADRADPPRNAGVAFARVFADELARRGVTDVVVAPGSRSTPVALAFATDSRLRLHVRIDERSASFLALGLARASGRPVPVLCTSGTAATHFHAATLEAHLACVPLVLLTADRPPELHGIGANQTIEQDDLYGKAVRWFCDIGVPEASGDAVERWRAMTSQAVDAAVGRGDSAPGPVHLNLPLREPLTNVDDGEGFTHPLDVGAVGPPATERVARPAPNEVRELVGAARRGVVFVGDALAPADVDAAVELAQLAGWPLVAEPHSNARRGPNALRGVDAVLRDAAFASSYRPDLILVVGRLGVSRATNEWLAQREPIVIDPTGHGWNPSGSAAHVVHCDVADLLTVAPAPADSEWTAAWHLRADAAAAAVDAILGESDALTEPRVARDLASAVPDGGALVVASSMPIRDLDLTMRPRDGLRIFANRGVSGIDGFVSTAMGVALAYDGPTYALAGDLSLLHDVNGLLGGDRPDLTLVVVNNDGGGIFSLLPPAIDVDGGSFERLFGTPHGVDISRLAAAYGVDHELITAAGELAAAAKQVPSGVRVVEVRTNRAENAALHARLREAAAAAVAAVDR